MTFVPEAGARVLTDVPAGEVEMRCRSRGGDDPASWPLLGTLAIRVGDTVQASFAQPRH